MSPPGGPNGNGNGNGNGNPTRSAQILQFPGNSQADLPVDSGVRQTSSHLTEVLEKSAFEGFNDFSTLRTLTQGDHPHTPRTPVQQVAGLVDILTNPKANGGIDATLVRNGNYYRITRASSDGEIRVRYSKEVPSKGEASVKPKAIFELVYYPDGRVGHSTSFDPDGKPSGENEYQPGKLRRAVESDHLKTLEFLEKRSLQLAKSFDAFTRLSTPLQQLRPSRFDPARRAAWYENYVVLDGQLYSIRTQNLGLQAFESSLGQNQITVHRHEGEKFVEVLRLSQTGEINHQPDVGVRQIPTVSELDLLNKVIKHVEAAHESPEAYQIALKEAIGGLGKEISANIKVPEIVQTSVKMSKAPSTAGAFGEPVLNIYNGVDLFKIIRPWPQTQRWVNPADSSDVRYLRPRGSIRWAMTKEFFRWFGSSLWHKTVNDVTKIKPMAGKLHLHLLPDGTAELQIHRNTKRLLSNGQTLREEGLYNVLRRSPDGKTLNLDHIVQNLAAQDPEFSDLPREQQLILADRSIRENSSLSENSLLQEVPEIPISQLRVDNPTGKPDAVPTGPRSALQALEAIQQLPELTSTTLRAQVSSEVRGNPLGHATGLFRENFYEMHFPGGHPQTLIQISEDSLKSEGNNKRVVVHLWQGDSVVTAVYDNGTLNPHESARLNATEVHQARQGHHRPWFPGWAFVKGTSMVRLSHYFLHGGSYVFGNYASLPIVHGIERLWLDPKERKVFGTPAPDLTPHGIFKELRAAGIMMTASGFGLVTTEGIFNWGGALNQMRKDMSRSNVTFGQAWRQNAPRWHNEPPVRFRPISKQGIILRNFLSRGIPILTGLLAVELLHNGWDYHKINWNQFERNALHVGVVAGATSLFWWDAARRMEKVFKLRVPGQPIGGVGGFLLRNKFMTSATPQVGGARFAMTYRASLLTILGEMVLLRLWDTYDRKQQYLSQEGTFRDDLSRALDHRNRIISRLEFGEEIPPAKILEAQEEVESAYRRYRTYLNVLDRDGHEQGPPKLSLDNSYGDIYEEYQTQVAASGGFSTPGSGTLLAQAKMERNRRLRELNGEEQALDRRLNKVLTSHGLTPPASGPDESLRDFLARTTRVIQQNPKILDKVHPQTGDGPSHGKEGVQPPVALDSPEGKAIVDHINWKYSEDPAFFGWDRARKAQWICEEFSGYSVRESDGKVRPWNLEEAEAFLRAVDTENVRRSNRLQAPLTAPSGHPAKPNAKWEEIAKDVKKVYEEEDKPNRFRSALQSHLANNVTDLDRQMETYRKEANRRTDQSLIQFMPQDLLASL